MASAACSIMRSPRPLGLRERFGRDGRDAVEAEVHELQPRERHAQREAAGATGARAPRRASRGGGAAAPRRAAPPRHPSDVWEQVNSARRSQSPPGRAPSVAASTACAASSCPAPISAYACVCMSSRRSGSTPGSSGQQPQRRPDVARGDRRRLREHAPGGLGQQRRRRRDRRAGPRARRDARAPPGPRRGARAPPRRGRAPAAATRGGGGVDGVPDDGCRKANRRGARSGGSMPARAARPAPPAWPPRPGSATSATSSGSNGSPATAAASSTRRAGAGEGLELRGQRGRDRGGNAGAARPEPVGGAARRGSRSGELLEIERVAAAELVQLGAGRPRRRARPPRPG